MISSGHLLILTKTLIMITVSTFFLAWCSHVHNLLYQTILFRNHGYYRILDKRNNCSGFITDENPEKMRTGFRNIDRVSFFIHLFLGKPQKNLFFRGPATKALPPPPHGHIFSGNFFWEFFQNFKKRYFF